MIQLVFAHGPGLEFGLGDGFPWPKISRDFKNFKARTEGTALFMGAKTFSTLPGILEGRKHYVVCDLNRDLPLTKDGKKAHGYYNEEDFLKIMIKNSGTDDKFISVIGGSSLLEKALPYADKVICTRISHPDMSWSKDITYLSHEFMFNLNKTFWPIEQHTYFRQEGNSNIEERIMERKPKIHLF